MLSKFGPESWCLDFLHTPMIDWCNAQLQIPKRDILLSFEHKRDISYCIHNKNGTCKVSLNCVSKITRFHTLRMEFPHFYLLDVLIT